MIIYIAGVIIFSISSPLPNYSKDAGVSRSSIETDCLKNILLLQGAVDKYNKESSIKMEELDISILINKGYIENRPALPDESCNYRSKGKLTDNGYVYCERHKVGKGFDEEERTYARNYYERYRQNLREYRFNKRIRNIGIAIVWPLLFLLIPFSILSSR